MREPVVITEVSYTKGQRVFDQHKDTIEWILTEPEEPAVSQAVRKNGARITVLSVEPYRSDLYIALSEVAGDRPALIARFGVGFDSIDTKLCLKHNIYLTITPGTLDQSVAEHTIALLLSLVRHISVLDRDMHAGKYSPMRGIELRGKPLGVAGFGRIGKRVAQIAAHGLGMKVYAYDCVPLEDQAALHKASTEKFLSDHGIVEYSTDFVSFSRKVRIIAIHMSSNETTRNFFNADRFNGMLDGTVLINTSRGALISEPDLSAALSSGKLAGAALDVFANEPYKPVSADCDLRNLDNVILTPHVASNTTEANENMAAKVVENIQSFLKQDYDSLTTAV